MPQKKRENGKRGNGNESEKGTGMRKLLQGFLVVALLGGGAALGSGAGSITGRLVETDYGPAKDARVVFVQTIGQEENASALAGRAPWSEVQSAANGWFMTQIPAGEYFIGIGRKGESGLCFRTDGEGRLLRLSVAEGEQTDLGAMVVRIPGGFGQRLFFPRPVYGRLMPPRITPPPARIFMLIPPR